MSEKSEQSEGATLAERAAYAESQGWCTYAQALERLATADLIARMMRERDAYKRSGVSGANERSERARP